MKKSSKAESKEPGKYTALFQQLKNLEIEWKSFKKNSRPRNDPRTHSSAVSSDSSILTSFGHMVFENSPRGLMSSLQHTKSPNPLLKVKNCDVAVEEILSDRRAAIMSGKLRGRRLFQVVEDSDGGGGGEISSDWLDMAQERQVMMINEKSICGGKRRKRLREHDELSVAFDQSSCSFSDNSSPPEEKVVVVEEEEEKKKKKKKRGGVGKLRGGGWGYMVAMAWLALVLILVTLGFISMSCNGKFVEENELILVPT